MAPCLQTRHDHPLAAATMPIHPANPLLFDRTAGAWCQMPAHTQCAPPPAPQRQRRRQAAASAPTPPCRGLRTAGAWTSLRRCGAMMCGGQAIHWPCMPGLPRASQAHLVTIHPRTHTRALLARPAKPRHPLLPALQALSAASTDIGLLHSALPELAVRDRASELVEQAVR